MSLTKKLERKLAKYVPVKPFYIRPITPVISFTFDDFPQSAATTASDILRKHGLAGTYYCVSNFANTTQDGIPQYSTSDIKHLADEEHEIGCHTDMHLDCQSISRGQLVSSLDNNSQKIFELCGQRPVSFSYPFGKAGLTNKFITADYYVTSRGIHGGVNRRWVDFSLLKANSLYSISTSPGLVDKLIKQNCEHPGWLIFYTHDVSETPSKYGCTPGFFEDVVRKAVNSQSKILPVKHAVAYLGFRQK